MVKSHPSCFHTKSKSIRRSTGADRCNITDPLLQGRKPSRIKATKHSDIGKPNAILEERPDIVQHGSIGNCEASSSLLRRYSSTKAIDALTLGARMRYKKPKAKVHKMKDDDGIHQQGRDSISTVSYGKLCEIAKQRRSLQGITFKSPRRKQSSVEMCPETHCKTTEALPMKVPYCFDGACSNWKSSENLCMLSAIFNVMDAKQRRLLTIDDTIDARTVFKEAIQKGGRNYNRGCSSTDVHMYLRHVSKIYFNQKQRFVKYKFSILGFNGVWTIDNLYKNLQKKGKYVMFGATRKNNKSHDTHLKSIHKKHTDNDKLTHWSKTNTITSDHAIAVDIDENLKGTIFDNGCIGGKKEFTIDNLGTRMRCINHCFVIELYEE